MAGAQNGLMTRWKEFFHTIYPPCFSDIFSKRKTEGKTAISADMIAHEGVVYFSAPFWEWFTGQNSILGIFYAQRVPRGLGAFSFFQIRPPGGWVALRRWSCTTISLPLHYFCYHLLTYFCGVNLIKPETKTKEKSSGVLIPCRCRFDSL